MTHTHTCDSVEELIVIAHFLPWKPTNRHWAEVGLLAHVPVGGGPLFFSRAEVLAAVPPGRLVQRWSDIQQGGGGGLVAEKALNRTQKTQRGRVRRGRTAV